MEELKKYKQNRKLITIECDNCGIEFQKPLSEYNRNVNLNRKNYCSRFCVGQRIGNIEHLKYLRTNYHTSQYFRNYGDEYCGLRYYYRNCKKRFKEFNLTIEDLKEQWDLQNHICPYTGFNLFLYKYKPGHKTNIIYEHRASIDRIDSNLGYVKGNIEFISLPINYLKSNHLSKQEVIDLLKKISSKYVD